MKRPAQGYTGRLWQKWELNLALLSLTPGSCLAADPESGRFAVPRPKLWGSAQGWLVKCNGLCDTEGQARRSNGPSALKRCGSLILLHQN